MSLFDIYGHEAVHEAVAKVLRGKCPRVLLGHSEGADPEGGRDHESSLELMKALSVLAFGEDAKPSEQDKIQRAYRQITHEFPGTVLEITQD